MRQLPIWALLYQYPQKGRFEAFCVYLDFLESQPCFFKYLIKCWKEFQTAFFFFNLCSTLLIINKIFSREMLLGCVISDHWPPATDVKIVIDVVYFFFVLIFLFLDSRHYMWHLSRYTELLVCATENCLKNSSYGNKNVCESNITPAKLLHYIENFIVWKFTIKRSKTMKLERKKLCVWNQFIIGIASLYRSSTVYKKWQYTMTKVTIHSLNLLFFTNYFFS